MRRLTFAAIVISIALALAFQVRAFHEEAADGAQPFSPTRLEWAAVELNASYGTPFNDETKVDYIFEATGDDANALVCHRFVPRAVDAAGVAANKDAIRVLVEMYRERRGWAWMKLRFVESKV